MKFLFFIFTASTLLALIFAFNKEAEQVIDEFVEDIFMKDNRIPGLGLSIIRNGTVLVSKGYGMRSANLPVDGNTLFALSSITKSMTAVLVVKTLSELYPEKGATILDIPVQQLIPPTVNFTFIDQYRAEQTTFRDLIAHRLCLLYEQMGFRVGAYRSADEYVYRSRYLPEFCQFRGANSYNNALLTLAGEMIAAIAGTTYEDLIMSFVRDLGMASTTYIDYDGVFETLPDMSQPYIIKNGILVEFDIKQLRKAHIIKGSGFVISSVNDIARYMNFLLNHGRVGDRQIVREEMIKMLFTISNGFNFQGGRVDDPDSKVYGDLGHAVGFYSSLYDGFSVIRQAGGILPYNCDMRLFPAFAIGIFMCSNGPKIIPNYDVASYSIFDIVRGSNQSIAEILSNKVNIGKSFVEDQPVEDQLISTNRASSALHHSRIMTRVVFEDVVGIYGQPYLGDLSISYQPGSGNTTLQIYFSEWAYGRLLPVVGSTTTFRIEWDTTIADTINNYPDPDPGFWVDFGVADTVLLRYGEFDLYKEYEYIKDATLDTFPPIPWKQESCEHEVQANGSIFNGNFFIYFGINLLCFIVILALVQRYNCRRYKCQNNIKVESYNKAENLPVKVPL